MGCKGTVKPVNTRIAPNHTLVIGAGLAGLATTLDLLDQGHRVDLLDRDEAGSLGGLGLHAFGGMALVDTPLQRLNRIQDSAEIALADWLAFAEFEDADVWPRRWARTVRGAAVHPVRRGDRGDPGGVEDRGELCRG